MKRKMVKRKILKAEDEKKTGREDALRMSSKDGSAVRNRKPNTCGSDWPIATFVQYTCNILVLCSMKYRTSIQLKMECLEDIDVLYYIIADFCTALL